jgi:hypothetical protein
MCIARQLHCASHVGLKQYTCHWLLCCCLLAGGRGGRGGGRGGFGGGRGGGGFGGRGELLAGLLSMPGHGRSWPYCAAFRWKVHPAAVASA